jgi:hypothetical protein
MIKGNADLGPGHRRRSATSSLAAPAGADLGGGPGWSWLASAGSDREVRIWATGHRPPATGHRPPATGHRPPATGHRPPATGAIRHTLTGHASRVGALVVAQMAPGWPLPTPGGELRTFGGAHHRRSAHVIARCERLVPPDIDSTRLRKGTTGSSMILNARTVWHLVTRCAAFGPMPSWMPSRATEPTVEGSNIGSPTVCGIA